MCGGSWRRDLRRWIATNGAWGSLDGYVPPHWVATVLAAKWLGVAPWDLWDASIVWQDRALVLMEAEALRNDRN